MLGLGGFVLLAVSSAFGELGQAVETTATSAWRQGCGVAALPHGRRPVRVRDLPASGRSVTFAVAQAAVALPGAGVQHGHLVGGQPGTAAAVVVDRTGAAGGVPAGR